MCHSIIFPAQSCVDSQIWRDLPLVLEIRHVECAAVLMAAPRRGEGEAVKLAVYKAAVRAAGGILKRNRVTRCQPLIQTDPANLHSRLERVSAVHPSEVVDNPVSGSDFVI